MKQATLMRSSLVALAFLLITGCGGWHLREASTYHSLTPIFIDRSESSEGQDRSLVEAILNEELSRARVKLAEKKSNAKTILVLNEGVKQFLSSVNGDGKASEYRIRYVVEYELSDRNGSSISGSDREVRSATYSYDRFAVDGSAANRNLVERRLANEIAQAILRRLQRL